MPFLTATAQVSPHDARVAGVEAARDVGAGHEIEQRLVVTEPPAAVPLADVRRQRNLQAFRAPAHSRRALGSRHDVRRARPLDPQRRQNSTGQRPSNPDAGPAPIEFHRTLPDYAVTPLLDLPDLAAWTGCGPAARQGRVVAARPAGLQDARRLVGDVPLPRGSGGPPGRGVVDRAAGRRRRPASHHPCHRHRRQPRAGRGPDGPLPRAAGDRAGPFGRPGRSGGSDPGRGGRRPRRRRAVRRRRPRGRRPVRRRPTSGSWSRTPRGPATRSPRAGSSTATPRCSPRPRPS